MFLKPARLKTPTLLFSEDEKYFENEAFRKRRRFDNYDILLGLPEFSSNANQN